MTIKNIETPIKARKKEKMPLILAHRGLVTEFQENTISAVKAAFKSEKCDGFEFDVFLTKDDKVVLFHDENLKRLTGVDKSIYDMTWKDLQTFSIQKDIEVDGGLRHYEKEEKIPLLSDVLEEIKGKDFLVNIELKAISTKWSRRKIGNKVYEIVNAAGVEDQVVYSSFNFLMLYYLKKEHRTICSGFVYDDNIPLHSKLLNFIMELNIIGCLIHSNIAVIEHTLIDQDSIAKYHKKDMHVGTYTLFPLTPSGQEDKKREGYYSSEVKRLAELDIDWIITDNPHKVYDIIHNNWFP